MIIDTRREIKEEINLFNLQKQRARPTTSKLSILTADQTTQPTPIKNIMFDNVREPYKIWIWCQLFPIPEAKSETDNVETVDANGRPTDDNDADNRRCCCCVTKRRKANNVYPMQVGPLRMTMLNEVQLSYVQTFLPFVLQHNTIKKVK